MSVQLGYIKIMKSQLIGFLMNFWISFSPALYFHSGEREEKCIIEDVPSDTLVIGNYKVQRWDIHEQDFLESAPGLGMFVTVTAPTDEVLLKKLYGPQATFSFTSYMSGEHIICLQSNSTRLMAFAGSKLEREENFRKISEETNSNILWWAILQTLILISVGIWQIKSLKDFFIAKKLV
uniref:Transmembrane emp24 domain-containing protein 11-like n=1 Tax=Nothoprocta perdicaria TaxID=30464 RepID=A0A8C6YLM8_NOTPE